MAGSRTLTRTLTRTYLLALALAVAACTVGERTGTGPEDRPPAGVEPGVETPPAPPEQAPDPGEPARVAVILPRSGPPYLQQYADLLLEGMQLAVARHGRDRVEMVVLDDAGLPENDALLVAQAMDQGAVAILGPLLSAGVGPAAFARESGTPVLISPTAATLPGSAGNVYTLSGVDLRGPRALAEYAMRGGLSTAAVLYPAQEDLSRQAWAFSRAFQELGGRVAIMVPYDSGTTTFGTHIGRVIEARPHIVYLPLSPQDVQVLAPQLAYYGLRAPAVVLAGNESWTEEEVLRLVSTQFTNNVIATTPNPRGSGETGWDEFVLLYEESYRRSLDNPFPALGYDAMRLVIDAVAAGAATPARVAEAFARTRAFGGATGVISVEDGVITRAPFLYRIQDGRLTVAPPPDMLLVPMDTASDTTNAAVTP